MGDLTRFQHQVLDFAEAKEQELKEEKQEEMREGGNSGPKRNSRSSSSSPANSDLGGEETIRYVNENLNPDHKVN